MDEQPVFEGLEGIDSNYQGYKEKATLRFLADFFATHRTKPEAEDYATTLICVAHNIDRYNRSATPKNISTLVDSYNNTMGELRGLYPETVDVSDDLAELLKDAAR